METFITWLNIELNKRNWRLSDLARAANLDTGSVSRILSGTRRPGPEVCLAIARALQLPPETIFRQAGLLPPKPEEAMAEDQLLHLYRHLDARGQREALSILKALKDAQDEHNK